MHVFLVFYGFLFVGESYYQASSNWVPGSPGLPVELWGLPHR